MSQVNIIIIVDVDKIEKNSKLVDNVFQIHNEQDCIYMHDDQSVSHYKDSPKHSDLISSISKGSLITWTLLPSNLNKMHSIQIESFIINNKKLFANDAPFIFCKGKRACAAISDEIISHHQYSYKIRFILNGKLYQWDPFVEVDGKHENATKN